MEAGIIPNQHNNWQSKYSTFNSKNKISIVMEDPEESKDQDENSFGSQSEAFNTPAKNPKNSVFSLT